MSEQIWNYTTWWIVQYIQAFYNLRNNKNKTSSEMLYFNIQRFDIWNIPATQQSPAHPVYNNIYMSGLTITEAISRLKKWVTSSTQQIEHVSTAWLTFIEK